jgi:hypothetical protein
MRAKNNPTSQTFCSVLLENFPNLGEVIQVETVVEDEYASGDDLEQAVMAEVNRIMPAISAMGGNAEIVKIDELGVVEVRFRGASRLQKGLELALLDVPMVKHVKFLS